MENTNIITNAVPRDQIYKVWLEFTKPIHKLTNSEIEVVAAILKERESMKNKISDDGILNEYLFSTDMRKTIQTKLKMHYTRYNNILTQLKIKQIIVDGRLSNKIVPNLNTSSNMFTMIFSFKII